MTKLDQFLIHIQSLFNEDRERIQANTKFRDLDEWTSLQALVVITSIDDHYGITLPEKEFREASTFAEVYELLTNATQG